MAEATVDKATQPVSKGPMADANKRKALGRGLAALMPGHATSAAPKPSANAAPVSAPTVTTAVAGTSGFRILPIERIHPNKKQPRKQFNEGALADLVSSIQTQGVLQPLVVRRSGDGYEIVAGERRWRAATRAGLREVPAVVKDYSDNIALQVALVENLQRQDLDPLEEAEAYGRLIRDHKLTHEEVALAVGKSRSVVTNTLRLMKLPEEILGYLGDGRLTAGHARALMTVEDKKLQLALAADLVGRCASVRDAETKARALAKSKKRQANADANAAGPTPAEVHVEERLQRALGTKVRLVHSGGNGKIEVYFGSFAELDALLDKLIV